MNISAISHAQSFSGRKPTTHSKKIHINVVDENDRVIDTYSVSRKEYRDMQKSISDFDGYCHEKKDPYAAALYRLHCTGYGNLTDIDEND